MLILELIVLIMILSSCDCFTVTVDIHSFLVEVINKHNLINTYYSLPNSVFTYYINLISLLICINNNSFIVVL